jgi:uncharacterized membrane protein YgaE (UPF0421/DUF939 family)
MIVLILKFILIVGLSISGLLLVRKYLHHSKMELHNEIAGFIYAVVGVIYAVLLAFVVITVWDEYTDAEKNVNMEISHVVDIYRNADSFPDSIRDEIKTSAVNYINDMIDFEWKAMANYEISEEAKISYDNLWNAHLKFTPTTAYEEIWYAETIKELNQLADARTYRINSIYYDIPVFMWIVIFFGAFITIGFSYLFGTKNKFAHIIMVFSLSSSIGLVLILIDALEHPFTGIIHLTPESFIIALEQLK